jgi:hypothetical protein
MQKFLCSRTIRQQRAPFVKERPRANLAGVGKDKKLVTSLQSMADATREDLRKIAERVRVVEMTVKKPPKV